MTPSFASLKGGVKGALFFHFPFLPNTILVRNFSHLVNLIREVSELPGYEIFRYKEKGKTIPVDSQDVNEYLKK